MIVSGWLLINIGKNSLANTNSLRSQPRLNWWLIVWLLWFQPGVNWWLIVWLLWFQPRVSWWLTVCTVIMVSDRWNWWLIEWLLWFQSRVSWWLTVCMVIMVSAKTELMAHCMPGYYGFSQDSIDGWLYGYYGLSQDWIDDSLYAWLLWFQPRLN